MKLPFFNAALVDSFTSNIHLQIKLFENVKANVDIFSEIVAHMAMKSGIIGEVNIEQFQNLTKAVFGHVCLILKQFSSRSYCSSSEIVN